MNAAERRLIEKLASRLTELGVDDPLIQDLVSRLCKPGKPAKRKSLKPRSPKREAQYAKYRAERQAFLQQHRFCQVQGCKNMSCDVHHKAKRNGQRLLDQQHWMAVCRQCHDRIGQNPAWAYQQGYLIEIIHKAS